MRRRIEWPAATIASAGATAVLMLAAPAVFAQAPGAEDQLRATIAAQMAQGPAASGARVVDLTDGHVVFDDRSADQRLSASVMKLYTTSTALMELGPQRAGRRRASSARVAATAPPGTATCTCAAAATSRSAPPRSRARPTGRARASSAWPPSCAARVCGGSAAVCSATRRSISDNGGSPFQLVLCSDPLFGRGCPYGPAGKLERPIPNGPRTPIGFNRGLVDATSAKAQQPAGALRRPRADAGPAQRRDPGRRSAPAPARTPAARTRPRGDPLAVGRPARRARQPAVGQLRGRQHASGWSARGSPATAPAQAAPVSSSAPFGGASGSPRRSRRARVRRSQDRTSPRDLVTLLTGMRERPGGRRLRPVAVARGPQRHAAALRRAPSAEGRCELKDGTRVDSRSAEHDAQHHRLLQERERADVRVRGDDERDAARVRPAGPDRLARLRPPGHDRQGTRRLPGLTVRDQPRSASSAGGGGTAGGGEPVGVSSWFRRAALR